MAAEISASAISARLGHTTMADCASTDSAPALDLGEILWGAAAIAKEAGWSKRQVYHLVATNRLPARRVGPRLLVSTRSEIRQHLRENEVKKAAGDPDTLSGVAAIAQEIGRTPRQTYYLLSTGRLPARKIGRIWVTTRREILEHLRGNLKELAS